MVSVHIVELRKFVAKPQNQRSGEASSQPADITQLNFGSGSKHRVQFGRETLLIGRNNAGKTTVIEALRVLSVCQMKVLSPSFISTPPWLDDFTNEAGFRVSLETIDFDFSNVQHAYNSSAPAIISALLSNNSYVKVFLGRSPQEVFCQIGIGQRQAIHQKADIRTRSFGSTKVMPPIGSPLPREKEIKERLNKFSPLSPTPTLDLAR